MTCKQNQGNSEKFFYNPISITEEQLHIFPNLQTLHLYTKEDKYINNENIKKYVNWFERICYSDYKSNKQIEGKDIEYKKIILYRHDISELEKVKFQSEMIIPEGIVEINDCCFCKYWFFNTIYIPNSVTKLGKSCFW